MFIKRLALISALVPCVVNAATTASIFYNRDNALGCATVVSVRDVKQAPIYDHEYERNFGGRGGSGDLAVAAIGFGLLNTVTAGVASLVFDAVRDPTTPLDGVKAPANGEWKHIKAVQVQMDDGPVMNLPLLMRPSFGSGPLYRPGQRLSVYWLRERGSIQLSVVGRAPEPSDKTYNNWCLRTVAPEQASEVFRMAEHLVDESLVVN